MTKRSMSRRKLSSNRSPARSIGAICRTWRGRMIFSVSVDGGMRRRAAETGQTLQLPHGKETAGLQYAIDE